MAAKKKAKGKPGAKPKGKRPPPPKSFLAAKQNLQLERSKLKQLEANYNEQLKRVGEFEAGSEKEQRARGFLQQYEEKIAEQRQSISDATNRFASETQQYGNLLKNKGFKQASQNLINRSTRLSNRATNIGTRAQRDLFNTTTRESAKQITGIAGGGVVGLTNTIGQTLPEATQQGRDLVEANLGETGLALLGNRGQEGLLDYMARAQRQTQRIQSEGQRQQLRDMTRNADLTRTALQNLSPEVQRATRMISNSAQRAQVLANRTNPMTRQGLEQQSDLARQAMSSAMRYRDPTRQQTRRVGNEMMNAATQTEGLADLATQQAMNYQDPTQALAQKAISGFQGLAGLQQRAAEDAYARAKQLNPEQMREADQAARESFASRGMLGSTGSVASEILNRESSLAARRAEAAGMGQVAQQGQSGLVGLASGYESDRLQRRSGLQQSAAGLQGITSGLYGNAGQFITGAESERLARQQQMRAQAMGLSQAALGSQQSVRGEARQARGDLYDTGQFYTNYGLPLLTGSTAAQQTGLGLLSAGLGMSGQASGILEAGTNLGLAQYTAQQNAAAARNAANASRDAGIMGAIGQGLGAGATLLAFSDIRLKDNLRYIGDIGEFPVFEWDWNDLAPSKEMPTIGFIAQMVEEKLPQFVGKIGDYLAINYKELLDHLGSSFEELNKLAQKGKE